MKHMKAPCKHCPFRKDVKPFLHPDRAYGIASHAWNEYNSFSCHKTTEPDEDSEEGGMLITQESKECAGFLTMRATETSEGIPEGFEPSWDLCYESPLDMYDAYNEVWENRFKKNAK